MKKCDHFKDLILTDYIDGELDKSLLEGLENHLLDCSDCRIFFKEVKSNAVISSSYSADVLCQPVPSELWDTIKQRIEDKSQATHPLVDFVNGLRGLMAFPKMVPVFASLVLMFFVGSVTFNTIQIKQAQEKDQGEYLVSLLSPASSSTLADGSEGETPIEHYFL